MSEFSEQPATPDDFLPEDEAANPPAPAHVPPAIVPAGATTFDEGLASLVASIEARGLVVEPWQVAAYVTAVRTKPLVTLAGISGTGKSSLPRLVAEATGAHYYSVPVSPDWTDSGDLVGHTNLSGHFVAGALLRTALQAQQNPTEQYFFMLDEINLARVEYYLAEVLSVIETRRRSPTGELTTEPLVPLAGADQLGQDWSAQQLPPNMTIVGSVNMDETTFTFAKKVLDRTFVLEFSEVDLAAVPVLGATHDQAWTSAQWQQSYLNAAELVGAGREIGDVVTVLQDINLQLQPLQQHVGYRVRDEVAIFVENAGACISSFMDRDGALVDPLDLALFMKVLPRIQGCTTGLEKALVELEKWADGENSLNRAFPLCQARIELMKTRMEQDGAVSYWV